ncbi:hypothetical protein TNCV_4026941 [Trichonephila clavipes]|nr:hypothetical protein TNCV_4026941 [Trichonephila clavipes]
MMTDSDSDMDMNSEVSESSSKSRSTRFGTPNSMTSTSEFEKEIKPIKVVIKGLLGCTKPTDVQLDLEELGYTVTSCNQLF